ncbi:putative serine/threonine-protein kinase pix13 [Quercus suber]|uniref:Serine/threonine-protein kinase pix13 n=1 Tax=Quercus suber TaxID=58331 RepID=A0AAW0LSR7_QUESU
MTVICSPFWFFLLQNYNAKISNFGLAILGPSGADSHVTTGVVGTYGYAAPEYIATGHLHVKSDVYGFGVALLEMLTSKRAVDANRRSGQQNLVEWLKPSLSNKRKLKSIMDIRMEGQYSTEAALLAVQLTLKCLESEPKNRPAMKEVVETLERIEANSLSESQALNTTRACNGVIGVERKKGVTLHAVQGSCEDKWDEARSRTSNGVTEGVADSKKQWMHPTIKLVDIEKNMYMGVAPDPDILIRTSGENRLSNFLLWQTTNCPLYSPSALWPEIGLWHLIWAVLNFQQSHYYFEKKRKQL